MSSTIQFDTEGNPTSAYMRGGVFVMTASGAPAKRTPNKLGEDEVSPNLFEELGQVNWINWGDDNDFPKRVVGDLRKNGMADRALNLKAEMLYGKRLVPCKVLSFDPNSGKEVLEMVDVPEINEFLQRSNINVFRNRMIHDFVRLANCFPMLVMNDDRSKISMIVHDKASKFRLGKFDAKLGRIDQVYRSANWPNPGSNYETIQCIDSYQQYLELDRIESESVKRYIFPVNSYDLLNDYYAIAIWNAVRENGHLQNSNNIPKIIQGMMKNAMTIKYHIKIPLSYWTGAYPDWVRKTDKDRESLVSNKLDELNKFLTGVDNPMKSFISHYATDPLTGKEVAGWDIIALDDKMNYNAWTGVATAASAEILFAIGINPAIFGLGTPGAGGTSSHGNGGSNIREAWLIMIASAQGERDTLHSWWPFVRDYNGWDSAIELRVIDQVLTTLDTGAGTTKTLS